jgi:hypothetical protein
MGFRSHLSAISFIAIVAVAASTGAHAAAVRVDPGTAVSAGKVITGSGQNLPSLNAPSWWNIGSFPAPEVNAYYTSGAATSDQSDVAAAALKWTKQWLVATCGSAKPAKVRACKAAAVFDIDDTLLDTYPILSTNPKPFEFDQAIDHAAIAACTTPVIAPTRALFNALRSLGVSIFLITGRGEFQRAATDRCLSQSGITGYTALILKPAGNTQVASARKAGQRKELIDQGWKIGPSIGDQISDMSFGNLTRGFLLPNVMYYMP